MVAPVKGRWTVKADKFWNEAFRADMAADDLADVLDILAELVREADLAALKAAREQIDANRARTAAAS